MEYWENFDQAYRVAYGCDTDVLYLLGATPDPSEVARKIERADVIYVGGGNTLKMMRRWRRLGVDTLLRDAYTRGAVLCGVSAGAICWFDSGHSDSMSFYNPGRLGLHRRHRNGTCEGSGLPALQRGDRTASPGDRTSTIW